jgi:copper transport protein
MHGSLLADRTLNRRLRRLLVVTAVLMALIAHDRSADASLLRHATLVRSEPAADSVMPAGLTQIRLVFSEPITPSLSGASIVGGAGDTIRLATAGDPRDVHSLVAPVPALAAGAYRLAWRIVSADGHPVKGTFAFRVAVSSVPADTTPARPAPPTTSPAAPTAPATSDAAPAGPSIAGAPLIPALLRGAGVGALMGLVGLLCFAAWRPTSTARHTRLATGLAVAAPVLLVAHLVAWMVNIGAFSGGGGAAGLFGTTLGRVEALRVGLAILACWALVLARRDRLALIFATGSLIISGAIGHPAAISPAVAIPLKVLHLAGVAIWLGGLLWLGTANRDDPIAFITDAQRVSSVALSAVMTVAISGVVETLLFLPDPLDIARSAYGYTVLAKLAGLAVLVAFGAHHRFRVMPTLTDSAVNRLRMSHSVKREIVVMTVVILVGGLLAYIPPPSDKSDGVATSLAEPS